LALFFKSLNGVLVTKAILSFSVAAPQSSAVTFYTVVPERNMSITLLFTYLACTDLLFDWIYDAYCFLKTLAVIIVVFTADAGDCSCEGLQRIIDQVLCLSRRTSSLLPLVLSPTGSFCGGIPVLHDCRLCNLLGAAIPCLAGRNYSRLEHPEFCFFGHTGWR
jgi:hypothetical protein